MKLSWMGLMLGVLWVACGAPGDEPRQPEQRVMEPRGFEAPGPRLFQYRETSGSTSKLLFAVELPQPEGSVRLARLEGCTAEEKVRELFGLHQSPIPERNDPRVNDPSTLVLSCPDTIPQDARVFAEPHGMGVSALRSSTADPARPGSHETYLVIPNRCADLIRHFGISARVHRQRRQEPAGSETGPAPEAERIALSCGTEKPRSPYTGWQVHLADTTLGGFDFGPLVLLRRDNVALALVSLDGLPLSAMDDEAREEKLRRLRGLFSVPDDVPSTLDLPLMSDAPELAQPLFDLCLERCEDPQWSPSHKHLVNGELSCLSGESGPDGTCAHPAPLVLEEKLQLDGSVRKQARTPVGVLGLASCGTTAETWERRLGFERSVETGSWLETRRARFREKPEPPAALELPCLKEPPTCRLQRPFPEAVDLSKLSLSDAVKRGCEVGDQVLELVLGEGAVINGRAFTVSQRELPPAMKTVRLSGRPGAPSLLQVAQPPCGFTGSACKRAQPALLIQGDLEVELSNLKLVPTPPSRAAEPGTSAPPPLARIALQAEGGAEKQLRLSLRQVDIGSNEPAPFYKGLQFSGGSLVLFNTNVRAFTNALSAEQAQVSVSATPPRQGPEQPLQPRFELASLAQPGLTSDSPLEDLAGDSLAGSVVHFRALSLSARSQAFLAGMRVRGPLNVFWADDRTTPEEPGLLSLDTLFTNGSGRFPEESVTLSVRGRGLLRFEAPEIRDVATVLECAPRLVPHVVLDAPAFGDDIRFPPRPGCMPEMAFPWPHTHSLESKR